MNHTLYRVILLAAAVMAATTVPALAAPCASCDRWLVPVSVSGVPGAYGSFWYTELWFRNNSDFAVAVIPQAGADAAPTKKLTLNMSIFYRPPETPGEFLYLYPRGADVQFDLRLFGSWTARGWGAHLPVIRDSEFVRELNLINIPTGPEFRTAVRVYGLPSTEQPSDTIHIRMYSQSGERLIGSVDLPMDLSNEQFPGYAQVSSLSSAFPDLQMADRVRIEVKSESGRTMLWAFDTVVSNTTQNVIAVTPR